ncbi:ATP-binding protein [Pseudoalteromonas sp. NBT06-2]|uniref:sensor histidine kinase n=1 Tax=Pseudoalteromonas sp. NBT06-2 TaxID=2025950 RepID=UPI001BB0CD4A|nr:ATP-binding protein [Pseudoalteromonas sp. NBT06-2]
MDDYSLQAKTTFQKGIAATLFKELAVLSSTLAEKKHVYNESNLLVYSLIQQLDSPVLLIDQEYKLVQGNQALSTWLKKDWRLVRLMPVQALNLAFDNHNWYFTDETKSAQYKIRSSFFSDNNGEHQLLILTDISSELRKMQLDSWQQLVKVLSHEIKNSLTPIKSLAQTLLQFSKDPQQKEVLGVIVERSHNLNLFVSQYAQLSKQYHINAQKVDLNTLFEQVFTLYKELNFKTQLQVKYINVDVILFEQVLINLIENAKQASNSDAEIMIISEHEDNYVSIKIRDFGSGIQNMENIFVPFYTTKINGQGIGLLLSRNIIEQHNGVLSISNTSDNTGVIANIKLLR